MGKGKDKLQEFFNNLDSIVVKCDPVEEHKLNLFFLKWGYITEKCKKTNNFSIKCNKEQIEQLIELLNNIGITKNEDNKSFLISDVEMFKKVCKEFKL